jgi:hypothetical protein
MRVSPPVLVSVCSGAHVQDIKKKWNALLQFLGYGMPSGESGNGAGLLHPHVPHALRLSLPMCLDVHARDPSPRWLVCTGTAFAACFVIGLSM